MRLLVLGDLHTGSTDSPRPPGVKLEDDDEMHAMDLGMNRVQKILMRSYRKMVEDVGHVDACLVNGDSVDGKNDNGRGLGTWTTDIMKQCEVNIELLDMIKTDQWYMTNGSKYHVERNMSADRYIARAFGAEFGSDLAIELDKIHLHACHKTTYSSSTWYRTTPIAKELLVAELNRSEYGKFHILVRSHAHYYCFAGYGSSMGFITPCWKGRDAFAREQGLTMNPHLGYILIETRGKGFSWVHVPVTLPKECLIKYCRVKSKSSTSEPD